MKRLLNYFLIAFLFSVTSSVFAAQQPHGQLAVEVLQYPSPMLARDKAYLVYELHITNFERMPITLIALQIFDAKQPDISRFQFEGDVLTDMVHGIGNKNNKVDDPLVLAPGVSKLIFVWLPFDSAASVPAQLIHKLSYEFSKGDGAVRDVVTDPLNVGQSLPVIVGAPVRGDYWVAGNGPSNISEHRGANIVINGRDYFSQRYAIDFVQIGTNGLTYHGDESKNTSYICYGTDVHAVADGKVIAIRNNIPENVPHSRALAVSITPETVGGNYVILDVGFGRYALYGHMIPHSITVKLNQQVKQGQVLGKVGNSGNSSEPHLHFQVVDKPSFLAANGMPYAFDKLNIYPSILIKNDNQFQVKVTGKTLTKYINQLALENMVINFNENAGVQLEKIAAPVTKIVGNKDAQTTTPVSKPIPTATNMSPPTDKKAANNDDNDDDTASANNKVPTTPPITNNNNQVIVNDGGSYGDGNKVASPNNQTISPSMTTTENPVKQQKTIAKDDNGDDDAYDDQSDAADN